MEETEVVQTKKQPAITISVQSWATPIVGFVMLIVGLFGGYYGGPILNNESEKDEIPQAIPPVQSQSPGVGNEELMDYLTNQARHFKGKPEAPVTIIEFGDFQ
ncbi:MAG: hypothetical protein ACYS5V_15675 [Planctomycetota bacterium]|jgi:hypothetical protein